MIQQIEAVVAASEAYALIAVATLLLGHINGWSRSRGFGDLPAGFVLGFVAAMQMFHPIEVHPGVLIDLRIIPLVLAGAFLSLPATLVALGLAMGSRIGLGGAGMYAGLVAMGLAGIVGVLWQGLRTRMTTRRFSSCLILGAMTSLTLAAGFLIPTPARAWFFFEAAPWLTLVYIVVVPTLAWLMVKDFGVESGGARLGREALLAKGIHLLPLPAFLRHIRVLGASDTRQRAHALLSIEIKSLNTPLMATPRAHRQDIVDAVLLRLKTLWPHMTSACLSLDQGLLIPLRRDDVHRLEDVKAEARRAITDHPVTLDQGQTFWLSAHFEVVRPRRSNQRLAVPTHRGAMPATRVSIVRSRKSAERDNRAAERFAPIHDAHDLFLKAALLMDPPDWDMDRTRTR